MPEQSAKEKIKEFLSAIITEHNSQLAATYLTKAEAAQIVADSSSEKLTPNLVLGTWNTDGNTYTAPITYTGDGTLSTDIGTIANGTLTVTDDDGNFSGVISAAEGTNFAPANLAFAHSKETVSGGGTTTPTIKPIPTLTVNTTSITDISEEHSPDTSVLRFLEIPYTYGGDGELFLQFVSNSYVTTAGFEVETHGVFYVFIYKSDGFAEGFYAAPIHGKIYASETANYAAAECEFNFELPALEE